MPMTPSDPLSVRLFPKGFGADANRLTGIAARCDWVVLSDLNEPRVELRKPNPTDSPAVIFLSLRCPVDALHYFHAEVLPKLQAPFVLVSGSEDVTLPAQTDCRWSPFQAETRRVIDEIAGSPLLLHWFAENLDSKFSDRVSPLPSGNVFPDNKIQPGPDLSHIPLLGPRPLKVLCGHRVRSGDQWKPRKTVTALAEREWSGFTTNLTDEVSGQDYYQMMTEHSFVLCVEGGGVDPSPKAWEALQHGAIPIIRRSALWEAYRDLPCVMVDDWAAGSLSPERLETWKSELQDRFDTPEKRVELAYRLSSDFWWRKITRAGQAADAPARQSSRRIVIICPGEVVSGGPEALHQLGAALQDAGQDVAMCYFPFERKYEASPQAYRAYGVPVCKFDDIGDAEVVLPEARTGLARLFLPEKTRIWWLSVDNYGGSTSKDARDRATDRHLPLRLMHGMTHLAQSAYAAGFLASNGLASLPLGDYLAGPHLDQAPDVSAKERIILYNPRKGRSVTEQLITALPDEEFVPIEGLDRAGVAALLARAKLYIDFGPHPGKDRLPREAALAGCCVLTGRRGAADNGVDTPIPDRYKIDESGQDFIRTASKAITDILNDWDACHAEFEDYRQQIRAEKAQFKTQVAKAFSIQRSQVAPKVSGPQTEATGTQRENRMIRQEQYVAAKARIDAALANGAVDMVLAEIEAAKAVFANDIPFLRNALSRLRQDGFAEQTFPVMASLCQAYPDEIGLRMDMGRCQLARGKPMEAEMAFAFVVARNPAHGLAWLGQIDAALARPDLERAVRHAEAALANLPHDPDVVVTCARLLMRNGKNKAALGHVEAALSSPEGAGNEDLLMISAAAKRALGGLQASDAAYREVLETNPGQGGAWAGRIILALEQGDTDSALAISEEACKHCPDKITPLRFRAEALRRAGRNRQATDMLEMLHERWPGDELVALALGKSRLRAGRLKDADGLFRAVLTKNPESWPALEGRVDVAEARGDYRAALALLTTGTHPEDIDVAI